MEAIITPRNEMSIGDWIITFLVLSIPFINIIMLFVWAFGDGNQTRANFCKAGLIWFLIISVLSFLLFAIGGFAAIMGSGMNF